MILVAIGSNICGPHGETPLEMCQKSISLFSVHDTIIVTNVSRWYRSAPVPRTLDQPDFVNGVVALATDLSPDALVRVMQEMEADAGRVRTVPNAPRPLDLDLIAYGDLQRVPGDRAGESIVADLALPHPRAHQRAFVLLPLREVAPTWRHPVSGRLIDALIDELPPQDIEPLDKSGSAVSC